jgi:hypothetical protein
MSDGVGQPALLQRSAELRHAVQQDAGAVEFAEKAGCADVAVVVAAVAEDDLEVFGAGGTLKKLRLSMARFTPA